MADILHSEQSGRNVTDLAQSFAGAKTFSGGLIGQASGSAPATGQIGEVRTVGWGDVGALSTGFAGITTILLQPGFYRYDLWTEMLINSHSVGANGGTQISFGWSTVNATSYTGGDFSEKTFGFSGYGSTFGRDHHTIQGTISISSPTTLFINLNVTLPAGTSYGQVRRGTGRMAFTRLI